MDAILDLLSPDQLEAIVTTYGTISNWVAQAGNYLMESLNAIVIDDLML